MIISKKTIQFQLVISFILSPKNNPRMNTATQNPHLDTAHKMLKEGKTFDQIQHHLLSTGEDSEVVNELMKHVKDERYEAQRKKGIPLIALDFVICLIGFAAIIFMTDTGAEFQFYLYGLTTIGATTIVGGLAFIVG